jgi:hypothetical protein
MTIARIGSLAGRLNRNPTISQCREISQSREIMRRQQIALIGIFGFALALVIGLYLGERAAGQETDPLRVQVEVAPGPYHAGQAIELVVGVIAKGKKPKIDPPKINGARAWMISTESTPISSTGIGSVMTREYQYVVKFRVLPARAGPLEIPAIGAQVEGRSGRSQRKRLSIKAVPVQGRPAEFLGGVGRFSLSADASPKTVRVGQELDFRIKVTGPAAWGMSERPDLARYERSELGLQITAGPDETSDEPPARTFVYRLRPTRTGDLVLPPVAVASFDPALARYATHVTAGVPVRVVAVPSFDPTTILDDSLSGAAVRLNGITWSVIVTVPVLLATYLMVSRFRRRLARETAHYPELARRYAKRSVRELGLIPVNRTVRSTGPINTVREGPVNGLLGRTTRDPHAWTILKSTSPQVLSTAAHRIAASLSEYLKLGLGRPKGALTPDDAQEGVVRLTGSVELGEAAARLAMRCDRVLYSDNAQEIDDAQVLLDDARRLFGALGRIRYSNRNGD